MINFGDLKTLDNKIGTTTKEKVIKIQQNMANTIVALEGDHNVGRLTDLGSLGAIFPESEKQIFPWISMVFPRSRTPKSVRNQLL